MANGKHRRMAVTIISYNDGFISRLQCVRMVAVGKTGHSGKYLCLCKSCSCSVAGCFLCGRIYEPVTGKRPGCNSNQCVADKSCKAKKGKETTGSETKAGNKSSIKFLRLFQFLVTGE